MRRITCSVWMWYFRCDETRVSWRLSCLYERLYGELTQSK